MGGLYGALFFRMVGYDHWPKSRSLFTPTSLHSQSASPPRHPRHDHHRFLPFPDAYHGTKVRFKHTPPVFQELDEELPYLRTNPNSRFHDSRTHHISNLYSRSPQLAYHSTRHFVITSPRYEQQQ